MNEECEGCHRHHIEKCLLMITDITCPCSTCLLKVICTEECIKRFKAFDNLSYSYRDQLSADRYRNHFLK